MTAETRPRSSSAQASLPPLGRPWLGFAVWAAGWSALMFFDGVLGLASLAMLLVLSAAVAALWLPAWASAAVSVVSVLAFNWTFVPPRGTFDVTHPQDALLLSATLGVALIVAWLMSRQRRLAAAAAEHASRAEALRTWGDSLRDADDPIVHLGALQSMLSQASGAPAALLVLRTSMPARDDDAAVATAGAVDAERRAGLWHCLRHGRAMGPGTGRHEHVDDLYLPLRGRQATLGASVMLDVPPAQRRDEQLHGHLQALCDQMAMAQQRHLAALEQRRVRDEAQLQAVRNALLAAISHDYRTPLATIVGAASSLDEQSARLSDEQRRRLARSIVDEARRLSRMTDNTLQLARLDAPSVQLRCDWESAEDMVGAAVQRARRNEPSGRVRARLEPDLPLVWCDAMMMSQLLDNLVDNALRYTPSDAPVEVLARRQGGDEQALVIAVRDRGPGIALPLREQVFDLFQRGAIDDASKTTRQGRGAGVGLAVCRAIARAHGGQLRLRARGHGGCSFECVLPLRPLPPGGPQPEMPQPAAEPH